MTKASTLFTRTPAIAAVLALAVLLTPALACAGTESAGSATGAIAQGDLIAMLPADVTSIGYLDYAALREGPMFDAFDEDLAFDDVEELDEFIASTGIDPRTDIHRAVFVAGAAGSGLDDLDSHAAFLAVATFDRARLEESLGDFESMTHEGHTLWQIRDLDADPEEGADEGDGDALTMARADGGYLTILSDDTVAVGTEDMVKSILAVRGGAASARSNERLAGLIEDVDPDSEVWFVSAQDRLVADLAPDNGGPTASIPVDKIRSVIFSGRFSDGLQLELRGRTEAEADAKLLGDSLNGMLAFGKMMMQSNSPEIFAIIDRGIRAGSSGRDVTIRADLTLEDIQQLRAYGEELMNDAMDESEIGG